MTLVETFINALPEEAVGDPAALAVPLAEIVVEAKAAHPGVLVDDEAFVQRLAESATGDPTQLASLPAADVYLALGCTLGTPGAAAAFIRAYGPEIDRMLDKARQHADRDERRQIAVAHMLTPGEDAPAKIDGYRGRGSLRSWVRVVAARLAIDMLRRRGAEREIAVDPVVLAQAGDFDVSAVAGGDAVRHQSDLQAAVAEAFEQLEPVERRLLRHRFADRMTTEQIAVELAVHRTTVARRVEQARAKLGGLAREALRSRLRVDEATANSLMGLVPGGLEISIHRMLQSRTD